MANLSGSQNVSSRLKQLINGKSPRWLRRVTQSAGLITRTYIGRSVKDQPVSDYEVEVEHVGLLKRLQSVFSGYAVFSYKILIRAHSKSKFRFEIFSSSLDETLSRVERAVFQVAYDKVVVELEKLGYEESTFEDFLSERRRFSGYDDSGVDLFFNFSEEERQTLLDEMKLKFVAYMKE